MFRHSLTTNDDQWCMVQCSVQYYTKLSTVQCLYLCIARLVFGWLSDIGNFAGSVLPSEPELELSRHESQKRGGDIMSLANKHPLHTETLDDFMCSFVGPVPP